MKKSIINSLKEEKNSCIFIMYSLTIKATYNVVMIRINNDATHSVV
jgi:hypothetical protein